MLKPPNYQNLFDFMYPNSQLNGLAAPCQINVSELNIRYAIIRNNQQSIFNALDAIVTEADEGTYFREFMMPYSEVAAATRTVLTHLQLVNAAFQNPYDAAGQGLVFSQPMTVFPMVDLGGQLTGEASLATIVYSNGLMLRPPVVLTNPADPTDFTVVELDYAARGANGGVIFYVQTSLVEQDAPVDTLVLRNFNKWGVTWPNGAGSFTQTFSESAAGPLTFSVGDLSALGYVYDLSTYQVFCMQPGDGFYRLVEPGLVASRVAEGGAAIFTVDMDATPGLTFMLVPINSFWDFFWPGTAVTGMTPLGVTITVGGPVTAETSQQFEIPLLEADGATPAPVAFSDDVDVYVDGVLLRPEIDYRVDMGSSLEPLTPPRVLIFGMSEGPHDIRCVANAPYNSTYSIQLSIPELTDPRGLVQVPKSGRNIRLMDQVGLLFSQGQFDGWGLAYTVGENLGLDLHTATSSSNVYYRARFCLTTAAMQVSQTAMSANLGLDKFLSLFGTTGSETILGFDYQTAYAESAGIEGYVVPAGQAAPWALPFETGYFWTRDRFLGESQAVPGGAEIPAVTSEFDFSFDCRQRIQNYPFQSWEEPYNSAFAGGVGFDGRPKVPGNYEVYVTGGSGASGATGTWEAQSLEATYAAFGAVQLYPTGYGFTDYSFYPDLDLDFRGYRSNDGIQPTGASPAAPGSPGPTTPTGANQTVPEGSTVGGATVYPPDLPIAVQGLGVYSGSEGAPSCTYYVVFSFTDGSSPQVEYGWSLDGTQGGVNHWDVALATTTSGGILYYGGLITSPPVGYPTDSYQLVFRDSATRLRNYVYPDFEAHLPVQSPPSAIISTTGATRWWMNQDWGGPNASGNPVYVPSLAFFPFPTGGGTATVALVAQALSGEPGASGQSIALNGRYYTDGNLFSSLGINPGNAEVGECDADGGLGSNNLATTLSGVAAGAYYIVYTLPNGDSATVGPLNIDFNS